MRRAQRSALWKILPLGGLLLLWGGLIGLLVVARGDPQRYLQETFGSPRPPNVFNLVDHGSLVEFLLIHSCLIAVALAALWRGGGDVFAVVLICPALALLRGVADLPVFRLSYWIFYARYGWTAGVLLGIALLCTRSLRRQRPPSVTTPHDASPST
mgnify:CR=1 FL=1